MPGIEGSKIINPIQALTSRIKEVLIVRSTMISLALSTGTGVKANALARFVHATVDCLIRKVAQKKIDEIGAQAFVETVSKPAFESLQLELEASKLALEEKEGMLALKDNQLAEKDKQLVLRDEKLVEKTEELELKCEQLAEKEELLGEKDEQLAEKDVMIDHKIETIESNKPIQHSKKNYHLDENEVESYGVVLISRTQPRANENIFLSPGEVLLQINYTDRNDAPRNLNDTVSGVFKAAKGYGRGRKDLLEPYALYVGVTNPIKLRPKMIELARPVHKWQSKRFNSLAITHENNAPYLVHQIGENILRGICTLIISQYGYVKFNEKRADRKNKLREIIELEKIRDEGVSGLWRRSQYKSVIKR